MISLSQKTASELGIQIAQRLARIRKRRKISQKDLSEKAGVSFGSLKRFERTGQVSLESLCKLAIALGTEDELDHLFEDVLPQSIEEVLSEQGRGGLRQNG